MKPQLKNDPFLKYNLFKNCKNLYGKIPEETQQLIIDYLTNPSEPLWEEIYCKIIGSDSWTTLWQAVLEINPNYIKSKPIHSKWTQIPTAEDVYHAVLWANEM